MALRLPSLTKLNLAKCLLAKTLFTTTSWLIRGGKAKVSWMFLSITKIFVYSTFRKYTFQQKYLLRNSCCWKSLQVLLKCLHCKPLSFLFPFSLQDV